MDNRRMTDNKDVAVRLTELYQWIEQERTRWGERFDLFQLVCDIEDGLVPLTISVPDTKGKPEDIFPHGSPTLTGERINNLLLSKGTSIRGLAKQIGLSSTALYHWIRGKNMPTLECILIICRQYGVSADWLLGLSDDPHIHQKEEKSNDK